MPNASLDETTVAIVDFFIIPTYNGASHTSNAALTSISANDTVSNWAGASH